MHAEKRRSQIITRLQSATEPISASRLAAEFEVSRQIIVQDVAILRAAGHRIVALSRGYRINSDKSCRRVFKVCHSDESVGDELRSIVDLGGTVDDVFIFHKVYGTVRAAMGIRNRDHVDEFLNNIATGKSSLLKNVTAGYHYHTVCAESEETLDRIEASLREKGYLAPLREYEPSDLTPTPDNREKKD
ncbi:MAG: transcription repressor NadR [Ruminococcaceae bacterium]|nr:transcription repressor NadR [Oscillospiraceae bacterium]